MYIKVRLYKTHDYDLCKLYLANPRYFSKQLADVLRSYIRCNAYTAPITDIVLKPPPSVIEIRVVLDDNTDRDVIERLSELLPRQRNSFIKNLFRRCLPKETMETLFKEYTDYNTIGTNKKEVKRTKKPDKNPVSSSVNVQNIIFKSDDPVNTEDHTFKNSANEDSDDFDLFGTVKNILEGI